MFMTLYNYIYVYLILESCVKSCWNQHNAKCFKTNALQAAEIAADKDTPDPVIIPEHDVITRRKQFRMKKDRKEARTQKKLKKKAEADDKKKLKEEKKRARDAKKLDKEKKKHAREDKKKEKEAAKAGAKKHQPGSKSQKYTPSAKETAKEGMDADGEDMIHTTWNTQHDEWGGPCQPCWHCDDKISVQDPCEEDPVQPIAPSQEVWSGGQKCHGWCQFPKEHWPQEERRQGQKEDV